MTNPITKPTTIEELLDYWPGNIPFKGKLVSSDGSCMCAQGQALHFLGNLTANQLRNITQYDADKRVAKLFGISVSHSVLLRIVNDSQKGAPSSVIRNPEQVLGDQAQIVLAFWRHLDRMTPASWAASWAASGAASRAASWAAAGAACKAAAGAASWAASGAAAGAASRAASWAACKAACKAAAGASNEIQGAAVMRAKGLPFFFLPLFGFSDPEAVLAAELDGSTTTLTKP
jgi:hypothetical protein